MRAVRETVAIPCHRGDAWQRLEVLLDLIRYLISREVVMITIVSGINMKITINTGIRYFQELVSKL